MPNITAGKNITSAAQLGTDVVGADEVVADSIGDSEIAAHTSTKLTIKFVNKGTDANKPASPVAGEVYIATDTKKIYICVTAGAWENITAEILDSAGAQGEILYKGASGWARLAVGAAGQLLKSGGAAANPSWTASATVRKTGVTSRSGNAASGDQNIAHGLGVAPAYVEIIAIQPPGGLETAFSHGSWDGTNMACLFRLMVATGSTTGTNTTNIIKIPSSAGGGAGQVATIAVDATNITLTWTYTATNDGANIQILWRAFA